MSHKAANLFVGALFLMAAQQQPARAQGRTAHPPVAATQVIDADAISKAKFPVVVNENNEIIRNGLYTYIVDFAVYRRLSPEEKLFYEDRVMGILRAHGANFAARFERAFGEDAGMRAPELACGEDSSACGYRLDIPDSDSAGGNVRKPASRRPGTIASVSVIDSDRNYVDDYNPNITNAPAAFSKFYAEDYKKLFNRYLLGHELGHSIFASRLQPGADYIGAAVMLQHVLRNEPEKIDKARELLAFLADRRMTYEMLLRLPLTQESDAGYFSMRAVRAVLALPPGALRNMTFETMQANAKQFNAAETKRAKLGKNRPELNVYRGFSMDAARKTPVSSLCRLGYLECEFGRMLAALEDFRATRPYKQGMPEYKVLDEFYASLKRLSKYEAVALNPAAPTPQEPH